MKSWILLLTAVSAILVGCQTLREKPAHLEHHTLYQEIDNLEALKFLERGIQYLEKHYSPFEFPVNQVHLRYSRKNSLGQPYLLAEGFSRTEIVDRERGICAIYIAVPIDDPEFYPLLAHEIGHLKEPTLVDDWEMEGFCMVFSEELCGYLGFDWSIWKERFVAGSKDPYARAYLRELDARP